jgi:hypothetical protein
MLSGGTQKKIIEKLGPDHDTNLGWNLLIASEGVGRVFRDGYL